MYCFQCRKVCGSLHWKQRTHKYMICCHIAHINEIFIILTGDFNKEQYVLPADDMRYAIEICRSIFKCFSVNNFRLLSAFFWVIPRSEIYIPTFRNTLSVPSS